MSTYRDSLAPEQAALYDDAVARAGRVLAEYWAAADGGLPVTEQAA